MPNSKAGKNELALDLGGYFEQIFPVSPVFKHMDTNDTRMGSSIRLHWLRRFVAVIVMKG